MLVGGGNRKNDSSQKLEAQLLVNGEVVDTAAGDNAGVLNWKSWEVEQYEGQNAQIRVVDQATGGWGHLTLDHIVQTDEQVLQRSDETTVNLLVDDKVVRSTTGGNSESLDFASWNVKEFAGQQAQIEIVDNNRDGWGHILADEFTLSGIAAKSSVENYDWLDYGRDYYASVSFANMPQDQRVMLGWMNNWDYANEIPTDPWRSTMSLPRKVELTQTEEGPRLTQAPVEQVGKLGGKPSYKDQNRTITEGTHPLPAQASGSIAKVDLVFNPGTAKTSGITVHGDGTNSTVIGYDSEAKKVYVDRRNSGNVDFHSAFASVEDMPVKVDSNGDVTMRVYLDRSSVEVFAQDGQRTLTDLVFPNEGADQLALFADGGTAKLRSLKVTPLEQSMFISATR
ncbi:GH32 C-terminal domain-containing protein [Glutamicibacter arilaitensis]